MATAKELSELIEAVRALAKSDEDIQSTINANARRGDILETEVRADIADSQDECCAEEGNGGAGPDGPCETPAGSIWCQPDEPWTNCETGEPIRIWPGGFPQTESCKECEPDPDWEQGTYWYARTGTLFRYRGASKIEGLRTVAMDQLLYARSPDQYYGHDINNIECTPINGDENNLECTWDTTCFRTSDDQPAGYARDGLASRVNCSIADIETGTYECDLTEPPDVCGEEWGQDDVTDLAIIDGCITGSKCDPDATSADQKCKTCQDMCQGTRRIRVCAKPHTGGFTAEDPNNPGYGSSYDRFGNKLYDYNPLG